MINVYIFIEPAGRPTGSCCADTCQDNVTKCECDVADGKWVEGGSCAADCGACCRDGRCFNDIDDTTCNCADTGSFMVGNTCADDVCSISGRFLMFFF